MENIIVEIIGVTLLCGLCVVVLFWGLWAIIHIVANSIFYILNVNDAIKKRFKERK